jgi:hypothetical protein
MFGIFLRWLRGKGEEQKSFWDITKDSMSPKNRRKTLRQELLDAGFCWITTSDGGNLSVKDLSYGGLAIKQSSKTIEKLIKDKRSFKGSLHVLHKQHPCEIMPIYEHGEHLGCSFIHSNPDLLLFLRNILEFLRIGSTMELLPRHLMEEKYQSEGFEVYSGETGVDLIMRWEEDELDFLNLSFTESNVFSHIIFEDGSLKYRRFNQDDKALLSLEQGLFILIGFIQQFKLPALNFLVDLIKDEIKSEEGRERQAS